MRKREEVFASSRHPSLSRTISTQTSASFSMRYQRQILTLFLSICVLCFSSSCAPSPFLKLEETCKLGNKKDCDALYSRFRDEMGVSNRGFLGESAQPSQSPREAKRKQQICVSVQALCENNQTWGCFATGLCYLKKQLKAKDPKQQAVSMFSRACKEGLGMGCLFAAETLRQQLETRLSKNEKEWPVFWWERSRPQKKALQVDFLGETSHRSQNRKTTSTPRKPVPRLPEQDPKQPLIATQRVRFRKQWSQINGYYQQGCFNKFLPACTAMGLSYELGRGLPILPKKAYAVYLRACRLKEKWACVLLGSMHQKGADHPSARFYYGMACRLCDGRGCAGLGKYFAESRKHSEAAVLYERACRLRSGRGCYSLASMVSSTKGLMRSHRYAYQLVKRGCALGDLDACAWYTTDLVNGKYDRKDPKRAWELVRSACSRGHRWSCVLQARFSVRGVGTPIDVEKGNRIFQSLCKKRYLPACHEYAVTYLPNSVEEDLVSLNSVSDVKIAVRLLRKNCKKNYQKSCYHLVWPSHWLMLKAGKDANERCAITNLRYRSLCAKGYALACYQRCKNGRIRKSKKRIQIRSL